MKHLMFIILSVILVVGCDKSPSEPVDTTPEISVSPAETFLSVGQTGDLMLLGENLDTYLFGFSARISYSPAIISFNDTTGLTEGDFFGSEIVTFVKSESSLIHLAISRTDDEDGGMQSGILAQLSFKAVAPGSSSVEILTADLNLYDQTGGLITISSLEMESATIVVAGNQ
ncbi:cohesin domain-containing protein [Candidatus Neomarinimicrobiota bacterium]